MNIIKKIPSSEMSFNKILKRIYKIRYGKEI